MKNDYLMRCFTVVPLFHCMHIQDSLCSIYELMMQTMFFLCFIYPFYNLGMKVFLTCKKEENKEGQAFLLCPTYLITSISFVFCISTDNLIYTRVLSKILYYILMFETSLFCVKISFFHLESVSCMFSYFSIRPF